jgi:hypothetical protein
VTRRPALPAWAPVALAVLCFGALYGLWVRPTQARIAVAEQRLDQARRQAASLGAEIARDRAVPPVPLPATKAAFDRLWPEVVARAQDAGYAFQGATFAVAPPLSGGAGVTPLEITARFTGRYLPLDETLARMEGVLPLWSWRSIHISAQQGTEAGAEITIAVDGVVPVEGQVAAPGIPALHRAAPAPPPPPPGGQP